MPVHSFGTILGLEVQHILSSVNIPCLHLLLSLYSFFFYYISITSEHFSPSFILSRCSCFSSSFLSSRSTSNPDSILFSPFDSHHCIKYHLHICPFAIPIFTTPAVSFFHTLFTLLSPLFY
ncbi:hypothetical protein BDP27DRAFT_29290 [Rhodocollybia butyracea]|uniref:Uncharacterized protein n=1 Tax=Rhodocollybia butyracea TaxID=206335 RepID=A0A9P5QC56_9AGAR|nr:hypothetical protein BDP27DRAFT_29290 [Rhodocollybia butyracea]